MKEGWEYKKLGEVCEILDSRRKPITKNKRESGIIPYYGATGLLDYVKDFIFDEKLVLLGEDGAKWGAGEISAYIIEGKSWVNNHAHALRPKRDLLIDELLVYYLNFSNLLPFITGVTVPKLNQEKMRSIEIPIGPVKEQQSIVDYLDSVKANAEKALNEAKALFQASLKEMLEPKEGWEEKTLKDVSVIHGNYGLSVPSTEFNGVRYLRITDITEWGDLNDEKVSAKLDEEKEQELLEEGDILFARTGATVGKTLMYKEAFGKCLFAGYLIRYRLKKEMILPKFLFYITHSDNYYKWVLENQKAAAQPNISAKLYNEYHVLYPPLSEQQSIVATLDSLKSKVDRLQANYDKISQECDALKQAILRQVFE